MNESIDEIREACAESQLIELRPECAQLRVELALARAEAAECGWKKSIDELDRCEQALTASRAETARLTESLARLVLASPVLAQKLCVAAFTPEELRRTPMCSRQASTPERHPIRQVECQVESERPECSLDGGEL